MHQDIRRGIQRGLPMALGYIVIGFSVAATGYAAGFSPLNVVLMSLLVSAGTAQLIAIQLLAENAALGAVVATTFIVNLRHLLMSSALSPSLGKMSRPLLVLFASGLTDESFALHSTAQGEGQKVSTAEMLAINLSLQAAWVLGALLAVWVRIDQTLLAKCGLDFAPQGMFIALLALMIRDGAQWAVAAFCAVGSILLARAGVGAEAVMVTSILGATLGLGIEKWISKKSYSPSSA